MKIVPSLLAKQKLILNTPSVPFIEGIIPRTSLLAMHSADKSWSEFSGGIFANSSVGK